MVGEANMASLKVAVMVTTDDPEVKLSESVSVRVTDGAEVSQVPHRGLLVFVNGALVEKLEGSDEIFEAHHALKS